MANIIEVISAVSQIRDAVSALREDSSRSEFGYPNEHFARIGQALSDIYFPENGILSVLKKIKDSESLDAADKKRLVEFNQLEEPLRNAMENLVLDHGRRARNSIQQSQIIGNIRGRKITLRSAVQAAINEAITFDHGIDIAEVAVLVEEIEALNQDIGQAEHELRQFM